ncbi:hypothetical protein MJO28_006569 [Puccinia striiformis f. sp. tritici]|uniref:Small secreted protein n=4 Tax=Puccinia striiformis TaxID=27350 RepID=A0A0L0VV36_9BASI|nr:hypothetical protein Pst134EA_011739 [Puccinia striiformis f. sp. tritici]KAI9608427.1 hypothetical protein KEM48_003217 [Puccinia striiformis f. sp. tritici PST-130]KNF03126.1 hypothetical protein PSTG_03711 [Puccinia striiformis f. sp. tritici PST-78]POW23251.1 hypothetical protein PSHT_00394 [Puccinia striiformis]KAH9468118.1 hypothetical protein Pst134EA_011739 [Puccinia striiformis f. sp. tritici]KAI7954022.1 hypothetical protein MJO28_006569 [Puccinia striiformis f. sp. tritici]
MKSFSSIASVMILFHSFSFTLAKNPDLRPGLVGKTGPAKIFPFKEYAEFQISDGVAGHALEAAQKVFVEPFKGDLSQITQNDLNNLVTMSLAAIENEKGFNKVKSKSGPLAAGKTANKVLKLVGEIQVIELHNKLGLQQVDTEARIKEHQTKLTKNTKLDRQNAGKKMASFLSGGKSGDKTSKTKNGKQGGN